MSYKHIVVYSHPRSGSHYLTALIANNFFNTPDYLSYYGGHCVNFEVIRQRIVSKQDTLFVYIYRSFKATANSIFVLRNRFGLNVDTIEKFLSSRYSEMWNGGIKSEVIRKTLTAEEKIIQVDTLFKKINLTPYEFYQKHVLFWLKAKDCHSNIMTVYYDDLMLKENFQSNMLKIAKKFGSEKTEFINIQEKVGWMK